MGSRQIGGENVPFVGTATGYVEWKKPSRIRQAIQQSRMEHYAKAGDVDYYFWIYPGDPIRTAQAGWAVADFFEQEQVAQHTLWEREERSKEAKQRTAVNALHHRMRQHECELLTSRKLPLSTPIEALALPRRLAHVQYAAHGRIEHTGATDDTIP